MTVTWNINMSTHIYDWNMKHQHIYTYLWLEHKTSTRLCTLMTGTWNINRSMHIYDWNMEQVYTHHWNMELVKMLLNSAPQLNVCYGHCCTQQRPKTALKSERARKHAKQTRLSLTRGGAIAIAWSCHPAVLLPCHSHAQKSLPTLCPPLHTLLHVAGVQHMLHAAWQQPAVHATRLQPRLLHPQLHAAVGAAAGGWAAAEDALEVDEHRGAQVASALQAPRDLGKVLQPETSGVWLLQQKVVALVLATQWGRAWESIHLGVHRHLDVHEVILQRRAEVGTLPGWWEVGVESRRLGPFLFLLGLLCVRGSHDLGKIMRQFLDGSTVLLSQHQTGI